ncbi:hypothetical protein A6A04_16415 [Paramagnetospirillum marisnigri]|uniref:CobQ/CobB/MinD/ParA nucleotide binding domain-containing protein n=1 Tax=Paramagnetospirillum marisnigri TaxID=1285242 RepID=A0A178MSW8_9PROT|nr:AAA family ATPase [Paramagnetospirillum marisnigri]OAN51241.1 hypothetical protein A6A04_16415 [Paramagnetospirillum marisnigri]
MKIAMAGKGGVGKTTLAGLLARTLAEEGYRVLAIDADPDANLASALPLDEDRRVTPLAARADLVDALSGRGGLPGGMMLLNPDIGAILPEIRQSWGGGHALLTLGWHKGGGQGCYCAENAVLKRVLSSVIPGATDAVVVDSEAGLEHLSRGTAAAVDAVLAVVQPGSRSVETAFAIRGLARDLGIRHVFPVLVGDRGDADLEAVQAALGDWPILARLPWDDSIRRADLDGRPPDIPESFRPALRRLVLSLACLCPMKGAP